MLRRLLKGTPHAPVFQSSPKAYVNDDIAPQGEQLAQKVAEVSKDPRAHKTPADLQRQLAEAASRNDFPEQLTLLDALAAATPGDPAAWLALGRAELAASTVKGADEGKLKDLALAAGWLSCQKARAAATRPMRSP